MVRRVFGAVAKAWRWLTRSSEVERRAVESRMAEEDKNRELRGPDSGGRVPW